MKDYQELPQPAAVYCTNRNATCNLNGFLFYFPYRIAREPIIQDFFNEWAAEYAPFKEAKDIERTWRMIEALQECML